MLVLIGATPEGKKELVGFQTGVRESTQSWRELLVDIKQRGLEIAPDLAVGDGALGFWRQRRGASQQRRGVEPAVRPSAPSVTGSRLLDFVPPRGFDACMRLRAPCDISQSSRQ
jgi:FAD/FMN-containing dehydrogenase